MIEAGLRVKERPVFFCDYSFLPFYLSNGAPASLPNHFADRFLIILLTQFFYNGGQTYSRQKKFIQAPLVG